MQSSLFLLTIILGIVIIFVALGLHFSIRSTNYKWKVFTWLPWQVLLLWLVLYRDGSLSILRAIAAAVFLAACFVTIKRSADWLSLKTVSLLLHIALLTTVVGVIVFIAFGQAFDLSPQQSVHRTMLLAAEIPLLYLTFLYCADNVKSDVKSWGYLIAFGIRLLLLNLPLIIFFGFI